MLKHIYIGCIYINGDNKKGYKFVGWSEVEENGEVKCQDGEEIEPTDHITLYADGQAGLVRESSLICYSLTINNILNIVILLILAGITINQLTGEKWLFTRAKQNTIDAQNEENAILEDYLSKINEEIGVPGGSWNGTVNTPKLEAGMIPIKYSNVNWVICSEDDPEWYNYIDQVQGVDGTSKWANVMLSDGKYKAGSAETENAKNNKTDIQTSELGSMFVWIPRYAYSITSNWHTNSATGGNIEIEFLKGTTNESSTGRKTYNNESGQGKWNIHPAFNYGETPISGFWMGKFQASKSNNMVKVVPNVTAWREITIGDSFTECLKMSNTNASTYGISSNTNKIDPHMIKNSEWGAVAYLTQSKYGRNGHEVTQNTNSSYLVGGGDYIINVNQSTTGNATGVYDMSGCAWERVSAYVNNGNSNLTTYGAALVNCTETKYKDVYETTSDSQENNYNQMSGIYGDAVYETSNGYSRSLAWYSDFANCPSSSDPFFWRGELSSIGSEAGRFSFDDNSGCVAVYDGFRPVIVVT